MQNSYFILRSILCAKCRSGKCNFYVKEFILLKLSLFFSKINIFRTKQTGYLFVDGIANSTNSPKKADILDVVGMLYVGGLPINYTTKRIGPVRLCSNFIFSKNFTEGQRVSLPYK